MSNEQKGEIINTNEPEVLGYMTNTEHLSQDGKGIPRFCDEVAIVGFAPSSMEDVQFLFGKQNVEIWPLNQLYIAWPRIVPANRMEERRNVTRWFQIHHRHTYDQTVARDHSHHEWLTKQDQFPIYMMDKEPDVPASCRFPREQILDKFRRYFTNTISWEIALAIYEGFKKINIFGVDMAQDCVAPETKVLTADLKWVPAGEIKVGDDVIGFDEHKGNIEVSGSAYRQYQKAKVQEANILKRKSYRIYFDDGTEIVASAGHKWLVSNTQLGNIWKRTDELVTKHHQNGPTRVVKCCDVWKQRNSWDAGYLSAAFDGEGYLTQYRYSRGKKNNCVQICLGFSQNDNAMSSKIDDLLKKFDFQWSRKKSNECDCFTYNIRGGKSEIMRFLGEFRPPRLLNKFDPDELGTMYRKDAVAINKIEYLGYQTVIGFKTSTKTFVAEGFASHNSEYSFERPSVEYFCGYAEGRGIELVIPEKSDLLKSAYVYPFEDTSPIKTKMESRKSELRSRMNNAALAEQNAHDERMQLVGALENMNYVRRAWMDPITDEGLFGKKE